MGIITRMRKQRCVYWALDGSDDHGQPKYAAPVGPLRCRWEDKQIETKDSMGRTQISNAQVYVDRDVTVGGVLWLVPRELQDTWVLADLVSAEEPFLNTGAEEIITFANLPKLNGRVFLKTASLGRKQGSQHN